MSRPILLLVAAAPILCRVLGALGGAAIEVFSILADALFELVNAQEGLEDEFDLQRRRLANLRRQLDLAFASPTELIRAVRETVEAFCTTADTRERTGMWTRLWIGKRASAARASLAEFKDELAAYTEETKNGQLAMILGILQQTADLHDDVKTLNDKLDYLMQMAGNNRPRATGDVDSVESSVGAGTAEA